MEHLPELLGIATAIALGAVSPGPSFLMVARAAVSADRRRGLAAALGIGLGGLIFATAALLGLHGLLRAAPSLYIVLKIGGGLYLAYLGWRIWRNARTTVTATDDDRVRLPPMRYLLTGLATQLSNPKAAIVYAGVFAAFLPAETSPGFKMNAVLLVFLVEFGWYTLVALVLSTPGPRDLHRRGKAWIDRASGGILILLGLRLATLHETP